jgi:hypothetical protein
MVARRRQALDWPVTVATQDIALTLYGQSVSGLSVAVGTTVDWQFDLLDENTRAPIDLTVSGTAVMFSMSAIGLNGLPQGDPIIARQPTIGGSPINRCTTQWVSGDTVPSGVPLAAGRYALDLWISDIDNNRIQQWSSIIPLTSAVTLPATLVTPLPSTPPLGQGVPGAPIVWRGSYASGTTYAPLDEVSFQIAGNTSTYICIATTTGHDPTNGTYWALSASGATGPTGPTGATGPSGLPDPTALSDGTVMVVRSGVWVSGKLTADDIAPAFSVSGGFTGTGLVEVGTTVPTVSVSASYPNGAATSATLTDGTHTNTLGSPYTSSSLNNGGAGYTSSTPVQFNFVLASHQGGNNASLNDALVFADRLYYDSAVPGTYNAAFIAALTGQAIASTRSRTINFPDCGGTKRTYYALPTSYGTPTFTKNNLNYPMTNVASAIMVTNGLGVVISYELWGSVSILNGAQSGVGVS